MKLAQAVLIFSFLMLLVLTPRAQCADYKLYWSDDELGDIKRANLDGSNVETVIDTTSNIVGMTASVELGKLFYFTASVELWSADLDGGNRQLLTQFDQANFIRGLAVDPEAGKLFWSSSHSYIAGNAKIRSASLDGTGVTDILSLSDKYPYGMTIDLPAKKLYWLNTEQDRLVRANYNGGAFETVVNTSRTFAGNLAIGSNATELFWTAPEASRVYSLTGPVGTTFQTGYDNAIAVDTDHDRIFWSDTRADTIYSANFDGSDKIAVLSSGVPDVTDLVVLSFESVPEPSSFVLAGVAFAVLSISSFKRWKLRAAA